MEPWHCFRSTDTDLLETYLRWMEVREVQKSRPKHQDYLVSNRIACNDNLPSPGVEYLVEQDEGLLLVYIFVGIWNYFGVWKLTFHRADEICIVALVCGCGTCFNR
jgi:hypothetical protein